MAKKRKYAACPRKLQQIREILWPGGDLNTEWTTETIEDVARAVGQPSQSRRQKSPYRKIR